MRYRLTIAVTRAMLIWTTLLPGYVMAQCAYYFIIYGYHSFHTATIYCVDNTSFLFFFIFGFIFIGFRAPVFSIIRAIPRQNGYRHRDIQRMDRLERPRSVVTRQ